MKITKALVDKLLQQYAGANLPASALRGEWVEELLREGVLVSRSHGSRRTICAANPLHLKLALARLDERLSNVDNMKRFLVEETSRACQARDTGNSKLVTVRSCPGFLVNVLQPLSCVLHGEAFVVTPVQGAFFFVSDWQHFFISENVTVVGIENMENFRMIHLQRALFASLLPSKRLLFVLRYPQSTDLRSWLQAIPNRYVHFGDFDLAGIHIFLTEFYKYLPGRASFLIPSDIEECIRAGTAERYDVQYQKSKGMFTAIPSLQHLIDTINKYHRCFDQEGYIDM